MTKDEEDALVASCSKPDSHEYTLAFNRVTDPELIRLAIRAAVAHEQANRHCTITGNLCLTDTWCLDNPPDCHCGRIYRKCDEDTKAAVAQERERAAKVCEAKSKRLAKLGLHNEAAVLDDCAAAIRRGE